MRFSRWVALKGAARLPFRLPETMVKDPVTSMEDPRSARAPTPVPVFIIMKFRRTSREPVVGLLLQIWTSVPRFPVMRITFEPAGANPFASILKSPSTSMRPESIEVTEWLYTMKLPSPAPVALTSRPPPPRAASISIRGWACMSLAELPDPTTKSPVTVRLKPMKSNVPSQTCRP